MIDKLKSYLESINFAPVSWLFGLTGVIWARFLIEGFSSPSAGNLFSVDISTLVHYWLFFIAVALSFILIFYSLLPSWRNVLFQLIGCSFLIILIAPIVDWVLTKGHGVTMTYIFNDAFNLKSFFNFFTKTTAGLTVELVIILFGAAIITYRVSKNIAKTIIAVIAIYTALFIFAELPNILALVLGSGEPVLEFLRESIMSSVTLKNSLHPSVVFTEEVHALNSGFSHIMGQILLLLSLTFSSILFWFYNKQKFLAFMKNARPVRAAHYILILIFGVTFAKSVFVLDFNWVDTLSIVSACIGLLFSIMFAICVNDIEDQKIDRVSNNERPLATGSLSVGDMKQASIIFLAIFLCASYLAGHMVFFFIASFTALYYIYSAKPTRYKIIPFFSSFIIGLCHLAVFAAGFYLISPEQTVEALPKHIIVLIVVFFSFWSNIRDVKDIEGDKTEGVKTIPVLFGNKWGKKAAGLICGSAFLFVPFIMQSNILWMPAVLASTLTYYFINKKNYSEKWPFAAYATFLIAFILLVT